ncbi:MAG: ATP-dependent zinc metalloprotease FtsH [Gemmatimonadota bacterium]
MTSDAREETPGPVDEEGARRQPSPLRSPLFMWILVLALPLALLWISSTRPSDGRVDISYSQFRNEIDAANVLAVTIEKDRISGRFAAEVTVSSQRGGGEAERATEFVTYLPFSGDESLVADLRARGVEIRTLPATDESTWIEIVVGLLPLTFLIIVGVLIMRGMRKRGGGLLSFGRSRARLYRVTDEALTFDDVAGSENVKEELREVIDFLEHPETFHALGGEVPRGVLLVGPPGTGKTLMARAVAGEAGVPFFSITGSDFMEMLVGIGAARVRDLFKEAKEAAPSIIFIDELDSIGRTRGAGIGGGHDEREQTLNQLLSELDGFEPSENVIVLAATNRPDILDPALTRAGRFDRHVVIDLPIVADREAILQVHARSKPLAADVDLGRLAKGTPGLSGADLENILNEAALTAARKRKSAIEDADIEQARDRVLLGLAREGMSISDDERDLLATHEAGHAVVAATLPTTDPVHKVSIVPRGMSMGATQQFQARERYIYRYSELLERIAVLLAGRAAEDLVFGAKSTGAADDLKQATSLARRMVLRWGMSEGLGAMATGREEAVFLADEMARRREFSEETASRIDQEIRTILDQAGTLARSTLERHRKDLDAVARRLLEREEISGDEVLSLLGRVDHAVSAAPG